ncbi:peptidylprolyl isomerase [Verrucomicrobium sp. GAS474]|uniref:peptidylprolyl isomerase n=1 Tax=Verrucomicrobium sp. GAS474 TaxID=1882831 RepID=UPI00087B7BFA|nr:peptidylprolyl isomerase [Verrucomicrobium sp. GAS474]SDT86404.1 peptidylprolyl isomerase [Verrucomicrobium sp. GAS474]
MMRFLSERVKSAIFAAGLGCCFIFTGIGAALVSSAHAETKPLDLENTLYLDLKDGRVVIAMYPDLAPKHVARIKELVRKGFYDGIVFHRVIESFMAQTGDPTGTGSGGSGTRIPAEFSSKPFIRGAVGMARSASPDSADSQWFICFKPSFFLDSQYTLWGQVVQGMEFVDNITRGEPPANPDKIVRLRVAADVKNETAPVSAAPAPTMAPVPAPAPSPIK